MSELGESIAKFSVGSLTGGKSWTLRDCLIWVLQQTGNRTPSEAIAEAGFLLEMLAGELEQEGYALPGEDNPRIVIAQHTEPAPPPPPDWKRKRNLA